jgi:hypothetical protein
MELIDKAALVAEIKKRIKKLEANILLAKKQKDTNASKSMRLYIGCYNGILSLLDTLEVKDVSTWHLQEKEDIYDAVKDWSLHTFACVMKDGTIQKFTGILDEDCEGHISVNIDGVNDDYDNVDDIIKWIELT